MLPFTMGKHFKMTCWRCGGEDWASKVSATFGCRTCRPAQGTKEYEFALAGAGHGLGNGNLKHQTLLAQAKEKAEQAEAAKPPKPPKPPKPEPARKRIQQTAAVAPDLEAAPEPEPAPEADKAVTERNAKVDRIFAELAFIKKVDKALASMPLPPRCTCCPELKALTETEDGKLFCPVCAYGVLRSGYCTFHSTEHYPEIAAVAPRVPLYEFPKELLGTDPAKFKASPGTDNSVVDP